MEKNYNHLSDGSLLKVKILSSNAKIPCRKSMYAAGFDLYSSEECTLQPSSSIIISTGISIEIPPFTYGRIAPKSGLAKQVNVGAGVIDFDYRGEVKVLLYNLTEDKIIISPGDAVGQLILEKIAMPNLLVTDILSTTERNTSGGINKVIN